MAKDSIPKIQVTILRQDNKLYGVKIQNHGESTVCAAVSILLINAVNSVEEFTDAQFSFDCAETGGDAEFRIVEFDLAGKAELLMDSLVLGLKMIEVSYNDYIEVFD